MSAEFLAGVALGYVVGALAVAITLWALDCRERRCQADLRDRWRAERERTDVETLPPGQPEPRRFQRAELRGIPVCPEPPEAA